MGDARSLSIRNLQAAQRWERRATAPDQAAETMAKPASASSSTERVRRHRARLRQGSGSAVPPVGDAVSVAQAFAAATGTKKTHLGRYPRDAGVRALVELYAAGFTQSELEAVVKIVPKQAWWSAQGKRLGLSSLSIEVVRRNLPSSGLPRAVSPQVAKVLEHVRQRREAG